MKHVKLRLEARNVDPIHRVRCASRPALMLSVPWAHPTRCLSRRAPSVPAAPSRRFAACYFGFRNANVHDAPVGLSAVWNFKPAIPLRMHSTTSGSEIDDEATVAFDTSPDGSILQLIVTRPLARVPSGRRAQAPKAG